MPIDWKGVLYLEMAIVGLAIQLQFSSVLVSKDQSLESTRSGNGRSKARRGGHHRLEFLR